MGNVTERADRCLQSHCTYWSADGGMKLIFWGRQCRHISFYPHAKPFHAGVVRLIWSIWTGSGLQPRPIVLSDCLTHPSCISCPSLHCGTYSHWRDTPTQWWIADNMHNDNIEISVLSAHRPVVYPQLGIHTRSGYSTSQLLREVHKDITVYNAT